MKSMETSSLSSKTKGKGHVIFIDHFSALLTTFKNQLIGED